MDITLPFLIVIGCQAYLQKGDFAKSVKFFEKSLRLYPLPGVSALRDKAERMANGKETFFPTLYPSK
jgi:hypothetical protein